MPDGTPVRLIDRLGPPVVLVGIPGLFCTPPRLGDPERTGPPGRLLDPGRFWPCIGRLGAIPLLFGACLF